MEYTSKGKKKVKDSNNSAKKLDKFYTNTSIVLKILDFLEVFAKKNNIELDNQIILEPCAGNGSFISGVQKKLSKTKVIAYDIAPEGPDIEKADFLEVTPKHSNNIISIGNPPFGYKGKLATSFINKCSEWGPIVIFVLPIQFRRYNVQKLIYKNLKLIHSSDNLPADSFTLEGKPYDVNCMFQVWIDKFSGLCEDYEDLRLTKPLPNKHTDFELFTHNNTIGTLKYFDKSKYKWDFGLYRQGFYDYSKRIYEPTELQKHIQYLFVKFNQPIAKKVFEMINFSELAHRNTSILGFSNTDVVQVYEEIKNKLTSP